MRSSSLLRSAVLLLGLCALPGALAGGDAMPNFDGGTGWINSEPLTPQALHGKIVLVDFWEYTCINCLRTLPYLREWYARYKDDGFVIVGVHTPEFSFSGERKNVLAATQRLDVTWPVVLDDDDAIWRRYGNDSWPHEYLFDQQGRFVEGVIGEGFYQQTEARIQALIHQTDPQAKLPRLMALLPRDNYLKPGAVCYPKTPEIIIARAGIANPPMAQLGSNPDNSGDLNYIDPGHYKDGAVYLNGYWHQEDGGIVSGGSRGHIAIEYHAIQVVSVMRTYLGPVRVDVTQDGKPIPRGDAGKDIEYGARGMSYVEVDSPRAYELLMNQTFGHHDLQLSPQGYGLGVFSFDFESCEVPGSTS